MKMILTAAVAVLMLASPAFAARDVADSDGIQVKAAFGGTHDAPAARDRPDFSKPDRETPSEGEGGEQEGGCDKR